MRLIPSGALTILSVVVFVGPAEADLTDNLVAWWTLDETSGTRFDCVGSNDLADNNTVTSDPGKVNVAAEFTLATEEFLSIPSNDEGRSSAPFEFNGRR